MVIISIAFIAFIYSYSNGNASNLIRKSEFFIDKQKKPKEICKKKIDLLRKKEKQLEKERSELQLDAAIKPNISLDALEEKTRVAAQNIESHLSNTTHMYQIKKYTEMCDLFYQDTRAQLNRYEAIYQKMRMEHKNIKINKTGN